jgi:ElaB/YqjD/DUF883 family membrane-anchored ribosome-binding protein
MNLTDKQQLENILKELKLLYKELEDNELLKKYYSGAQEIEYEIRINIQIKERLCKIRNTFSSKKE